MTWLTNLSWNLKFAPQKRLTGRTFCFFCFWFLVYNRDSSLNCNSSRSSVVMLFNTSVYARFAVSTILAIFHNTVQSYNNILASKHCSTVYNSNVFVLTLTRIPDSCNLYFSYQHIFCYKTNWNDLTSNMLHCPDALSRFISRINT